MKYRRNFEFSPKMLLVFLTLICGILLSVSVLCKNITTPFSNIVGMVIVPMQDGINSFGVWTSEHLGSFKSIKELQAENKKLQEKVNVPVILWDERGTTVTAHQYLNETNVRGKKRKDMVDEVAASIILESYLSYRQNHPDEK